MSKTLINIACGDAYVGNWINFDFSPHSVMVKQANLLGRLPITKNTADVVYSSHFIEHIPRDLVVGFLEECQRIMKVGGRLRLVLPDWEELCSTYLSLRQAGGARTSKFFDVRNAGSMCTSGFWRRIRGLLCSLTGTS